jgi:predicted PurR-regulated permease PerM
MPAWVGKALFAFALLFLLQWAQVVLLPLALALLLTFLLYGPVRALVRLGVPSALGAALVVVACLGCIGIAGSMLAGPAADWWQRAPSNMDQLGGAIDRMRMGIPGLEPPHRLSRNVMPPDPVKEQLKTQGFTFTRAVLTRFYHFAVAAAMTVILLYFMLASEYRLLTRTVGLIPRRRTRAVVLAGFRQAQREIGRYLATQGLINGCLGLLVAFGLMQAGLPNPMLWGSLVAIFNFVPYLGPLLILCLLAVAGTLSFNTVPQMLAPAGIYMVLHGLESNFITPLVVGRRLRLSPMAVFLSVMLWGWIWGIAGAFIAVPMLLAIRAACRRVRNWRLLYVYLDETPAPPPSLRSLLRRKRRPESLPRPG